MSVPRSADSYVAVFDRPVQVRAGYAAGGAREAEELALLHPVSGLHVDAAHVHRDRDEAVAKIKEDAAAFVVEVRIGENDRAGHGRADFRARGDGDVLTVVDAG